MTTKNWAEVEARATACDLTHPQDKQRLKEAAEFVFDYLEDGRRSPAQFQLIAESVGELLGLAGDGRLARGDARIEIARRVVESVDWRSGTESIAEALRAEIITAYLVPAVGR